MPVFSTATCQALLPSTREVRYRLPKRTQSQEPQRYLSIGILEEETVRCQLIYVWGPYEPVSVTAQRGAEVIHDDQENIRGICAGGRVDFRKATLTHAQSTLLSGPCTLRVHTTQPGQGTSGSQRQRPPRSEWQGQAEGARGTERGEEKGGEGFQGDRRKERTKDRE